MSVHVNVFDHIPSGFFNLLGSQSNARVYVGCLQVIYGFYEHEISYRLPRSQVKDALTAYLIENHIEIEDPDLSVQMAPAELATAILHRFAGADVGWIVDEIDDTTYGHNIVMTEQGIALAEFLQQLSTPERAEFSGYIFDIYNRLSNEEQWRENPYVNAVKAVYDNARGLSGALKKLSTFIRDIIARMVKEESLQSLTENIIEYCDGEFIREYARLNRQQNIHIYRRAILRRLRSMQEDEELLQQIVKSAQAETGMTEQEASDMVLEKIALTRKFLSEDYEKILADIAHKINLYLHIAVGRARFLQNQDPDTRGSVEQVLRLLIDHTEETGLKEELPEAYGDLVQLTRNEFIDTDSLRFPQQKKKAMKSEAQTLETITDEEKSAALHEQQMAAYNPYSRDKMKTYLLRQMNGAKRIHSEELPMDSKEELLAALSAVAYGKENGFSVELRDGYWEKGHLCLRKFDVIDEGSTQPRNRDQ